MYMHMCVWIYLCMCSWRSFCTWLFLSIHWPMNLFVYIYWLIHRCISELIHRGRSNPWRFKAGARGEVRCCQDRRGKATYPTYLGIQNQHLAVWFWIGAPRFQNLKEFIMDPTLESVQVESWFVEYLEQSWNRNTTYNPEIVPCVWQPRIYICWNYVEEIFWLHLDKPWCKPMRSPGKRKRSRRVCMLKNPSVTLKPSTAHRKTGHGWKQQSLTVLYSDFWGTCYHTMWTWRVSTLRTAWSSPPTGPALSEKIRPAHFGYMVKTHNMESGSWKSTTSVVQSFRQLQAYQWIPQIIPMLVNSHSHYPWFRWTLESPIRWYRDLRHGAGQQGCAPELGR